MDGFTTPNWLGFHRAPDGTLLWLGWAVFGHILPRIGWQDFPCHEDGTPFDGLGDGYDGAKFVRTAFVAEWLGWGYADIRPSHPRPIG